MSDKWLGLSMPLRIFVLTLLLPSSPSCKHSAVASDPRFRSHPPARLGSQTDLTNSQGEIIFGLLSQTEQLLSSVHDRCI